MYIPWIVKQRIVLYFKNSLLLDNKSFMVHSIATYVYIIFLILQVVTLLTFKTDIL